MACRVTTAASDALFLERIPYDPVGREATIVGPPDLAVYHGAPWLAFLSESQGAETVVAVVRAGDRRVGHFVGAIVRRFGVRILRSPLPLWGTQCMGFLLDPGVDRRAVAAASPAFAFDDLGCFDVELADRELMRESMGGWATRSRPDGPSWSTWRAPSRRSWRA